MVPAERQQQIMYTVQMDSLEISVRQERQTQRLIFQLREAQQRGHVLVLAAEKFQTLARHREIIYRQPRHVLDGLILIGVTAQKQDSKQELF